MSNSPWEYPEFARLSLAGINQRFLPGTAQEVDFLVAELALRPGAAILDLGCGGGRHAIELAQRGYRVVGVDVSPTLLDHACQAAAAAGVEITLVQMNLAAFDAPSFRHQHGTFDAALCLCESGLGVLGGYRPDLSFLQGAHDVLQTGARLVITTFNGIRRYRRCQEGDARFDFAAAVVHWSAPLADGRVLHENQRVYTPSELALLLELAGFRSIAVYGTAPGQFGRRPLGADDIEMMLTAVA